MTVLQKGTDYNDPRHHHRDYTSPGVLVFAIADRFSNGGVNCYSVETRGRELWTSSRKLCHKMSR